MSTPNMNPLALVSKRAKTALYLLLAVIFFLFLGSCSKATPAKRLPLPAVSLQSFIELNNTALPSLDDGTISSILGQALRVEVIPFPNHHVRGQLDSIHTYYYEGLAFSVYHVSYSKKAFITDMLVSSPLYETAAGLRVGNSQSEVIALLGQPVKQSANQASYQLSDANDLLIISYKKGQVDTLRWEFYWD